LDVIASPAQSLIETEDILPKIEYVDGVIKLADGMILIHDLDSFLSLEEEKFSGSGAGKPPETRHAPDTTPLHCCHGLSEFVAMQTGLYFPQDRWGDLERGIAEAAPDFNCPDRETCAHWLLSAPLTRHMNEILASHLSIGGRLVFSGRKQSLGVF